MVRQESEDFKLRLARQDDSAEVTLLQHAAYAPNRAILGAEPLPLLVSYDKLIRAMEVWLAHGGGKLEGVLVLQPQDRQLLIWSVVTSVASQSKGLGNHLLSKAESRARELGLAKLVLYTGSLLTDRIAWYQRKGFTIEREEQLDDRNITHMGKFVTGPAHLSG